MMHVILCLIVLDLLHFQSVKSDRISSKLDFGQDDHYNADRIITIGSPERLTKLQISKPEGATVICSTTGCNKTETKQEDVVSDVFVHVKTSVNIPKAKNETVEETPDVPVVLGYGRNSHEFNTDGAYGTNTQQFNPDDLVNSNPVVVSSVENTFPETSFVPISEPKFQHHPPRKFYSPNYKQVSYDTNLLYVPYLGPSSHNYHFGEQPPLQYSWMPKGGASFNPVEFKRFERPAWNAVWNRPIGSHPQQRTTTGYTTCTCNNPGLNWYPTTPTWNMQSRGSEAHIDDKLAPLN